MTLNEQDVEQDKSAIAEIAAADDPLSSNVASEGHDDDRIKTSLTDEINALDESNDFDDMESLLPMDGILREDPEQTKSGMNSLDIDDGGGDNISNNTILRNGNFCFGMIRSTRTVGKMRILFPDYFHSSGWGVLGPNLVGPAVVWFILVLATHGVVNGIKRHNLGTVSAAIAYFFLALSTYRLTDVCYRDPGICLEKEIPGHESPERARQYRYCDRCKVWQPPDGVHCPECDVCVSGYDHYCVWMGTCIGKKNYRQFVKFNITWMLYILYAVFWVAAIGPLVMKHKKT